MFDERKQMRRLVDVWISQAEARQRAGRAGRVRAGYAFRLYTRDRFTSVMQPARLPEMLRGPLQELCLQLRLAPLLEQYDLRAAFARALEPPKETTVESAIVALQRSNALDASEALTPLGRHLAALPVEICIGRLMIYGALFKCVDPILLIAAALSDRSPFLQPLAKRDEARAAQICFNRDESDHLALVDAYNRWMHTRRTESASAAKRFCDRHFLSERSLQGMGEAAEQYWGNLAELGLLPDLRRIQGEEDKFAARCSANVHADSPRLLKAVLAAGLFPNVLLASPGRARPTLTQQKQSVSIHPSSFNHMATKFETSFLVFHEKVKTNKIVVHDVTAVTALDLLLLTGEPQVWQTALYPCTHAACVFALAYRLASFPSLPRDSGHPSSPRSRCHPN
jgi:HrpA-like RNA helicase